MGLQQPLRGTDGNAGGLGLRNLVRAPACNRFHLGNDELSLRDPMCAENACGGFQRPTELRGKKIRITDDTRIRESLPHDQLSAQSTARKRSLMSHFGRPKGSQLKNIRFVPSAIICTR
jgi:hypothetical protein